MPDAPQLLKPRTLRDPAALVQAGLVSPEAQAGLERVAEHYAMAITPTVQALIDRSNPRDPIALQYVPNAAELVTLPSERSDPTSDAPFTPVKGVVHRYPDRALLKPLLACPVYCRFCFRREVVGPDGGLLTEAELDAALDWFAATPTVREAILTGGDPLMLSSRRLRHMIERLSAVPHLDIIRLHSRVPVAAPERINDDIIAALSTHKAVFLCVHANHGREFTAEAAQALRRLRLGGVTLLGQSVLLRGVNDTAEALENLFRTMLTHQVKPYYLHQLDRAPGTARFEVPIAEGRRLLRQLRGRLTGLAWPTYVLDLPDGSGKAPLGPDFARQQDDAWLVEGPLDGTTHRHGD
ncbi:lysine-2,3-aminomutase-like protein [Roseomonas haemaphysalidis]|uniref:Lysine-2,3-aminomutase-like protein n=1 Tax=Roseomonas haemaphysalidis TaxID=2768162 RepID=A0ABS3KU18_9PROT|nr:lysine-2,3-aminomutase-like protein [Roseomonas haemaphysalidis]MBO1080420.1 lysine-2,3-aminomutase-like protein [Roseomonas haemaphysalidis]